MTLQKNYKRIAATIMLVAILANILMPIVALAEKNEKKKVRVGWFDSAMCYYDKFGRRCGVDYEYHQKISAYTGWEYEYVEGSWPDLFEMLKNGEIDVLSDVSYTPEREEFMYFADLPMGSEAYYIYVAEDNTEIKQNDLSTFNGKKIGVNKGSYQEMLLNEWLEKNEITADVIPITDTEDEAMERIVRKELDGIATVFAYDYNRAAAPVTRIGGSEYYYAVSKSRPDLLAEMNAALAQIQDDDPYFNERLSKERIYYNSTNALLSSEQENWLAKHGEIRIGYRADYYPFCWTDEETGELTGALTDYLTHAENTLNSPYLKFKPIPYDSIRDALAALDAGEIDCVFPVCMSSYDAEQSGIMLTDTAMDTEMNAVMRKSDSRTLSSESSIVFAVNENMINPESFIKEKFPDSEMKFYHGLQACYDAIADGEADCVLLSSFRVPPEEEKLEKKKLHSVPTGEILELSFAVKRSELELYAVMNKTVLTTKSTDVNSALAAYMLKKQKVSFMQFMKDNWLIVLAVLTVMFALILIQLIRRLRAERLASRQKQMLEKAVHIAELQQTISSLLDNMPGICLTKDASTGEYLACNQTFADYIHKKDPSEVIGLKASDVFDEERVKNFAEDDELVLSMDEPLIFYDNMEDVFGNPVNVKVTKQKYTDANGKLCILMIYQDVSDSLRISRGKVNSKDSYEKARSNGLIFTHIAQALARGFSAVFYVDINTEEFIEYRSDEKDGSLCEIRRGWHFFEAGHDAAEANVYHEDREEVLRAMDRKTLEATLDKNNMFMMTYRMVIDGQPRYVNMKVTRMQDDERYMILSMTDIDEQMKHRQAAQRMQEEQIAYSRVSALAGEFMCIYIVEPERGWYREYSSSAAFAAFGMPTEGQDFLSDFRENTIKVVYSEDKNRVFTALTMENVIEEVRKNDIFTLSYRLVISDEPRYVQLKAAIVEEQNGSRLVVGVNDIDAQVRQEEEYSRRLAQARIEANIDALTGVKNRNAYRVYEERLNAQIEMNRAPDFAITILDLNDLKKVNDTQGHKAGDQYIRDACRLICTTFKRSPVFRVGGDEFAVLSQGDDYERIEELVKIVNDHNEEAILNGGIVVALGMARYDHAEKVAQVYERADQRMYENKSYLKEKKQRG